MRPIDGVLFDLDGTLVDSEKFHLEAWNALVVRAGHVPGDHWNLDCVGLPDTCTGEKALRLFPGIDKFGDPVAEKRTIFREILSREGRGLIFPGVEERLERLVAAGFRLAIGTNSPRGNTLATLDAAGLRRFFPEIVTLDSVARGKPAPDIYASAASRLDLDPERCAVIEDSPAGVLSGLAAGCFVLAVMTTWSADRLPGAESHYATTAAAMD
ncbi:MAG: HAD family phosphatase, partial [Planctomycetota bacterium]|nr:HAD family phosphatase [Planctomycetota bacterium]